RLHIQPVDPLLVQTLDERTQERAADAAATRRRTDRHPRDLRDAPFAVMRPGEEAGDAGLVDSDETGMRADRERAVTDALLVPEPLGQAGDDRVARRSIPRFELADGLMHGGEAYGP